VEALAYEVECFCSGQLLIKSNPLVHPIQQPLTPQLWTTISFADRGIASREGVMGTLRRIRSTVGEILDDLQAFLGI
jgi:hypothetical protein